jgi:hypothetical protein
MKRAALAATVLFAFALRATAQTTLPTYTFVTVDEVQTYARTVRVTGILQGEASPTTTEISFGYVILTDVDQVAACERKALLAMAKPGQYLLKLQPGNYSFVPRCTLTRVNQ